ncbi:hypothetical protein Poli38472_004569 [Pythium oligandrum]|uniref:Uncharacterized protein n=1 Tax=Pythium oligandrum TaxID=41045 RepID=A0A8K1CAH2_PYTOL|nr:hypothetical protein Poli38472_004569 [Pythium oligandrum]|eukprot:TMW59500.1 hypothetical protein Poli38472_004569 [Pythium oligandrum]
MARKEIFNDLNLVIRLNQHIEEISNDTDAAESLLTKETSFKILAELSSLTTPDPREDARFDHQRADFLVSDASHLPFHLQGDQSFNEAAALAKRRALRHSTPIKDKIAFLWNVARGRKAVALMRTASSKRDGSFKTTSEAIDESEYTDMMLLVFKVLREDFVLESAKLQIHCDWEVDSRHGKVLANDQFFQAIFELVDVWTCDIVEQTYVRFLELLTRRITLRVVVFLDDMKLKLALSDNFDEAVVVKAIPLSTIQKFASVAKIMESQGVRTVGELANADPHVVETQRVAHLNRNDFSREKIGADLQHLLDMFREISQQFQHANYFFHNMVLQRQPDESNSEGGSNEPMAEVSRASANGDISSPTRHETIPSGQQASAKGMIGQDGAIHSSAGPTSPQRGLPQSMGSNHNRLGAHSELTASNTSFESLKNLQFTPPRRGLRRINTFHDLSVTETGVIDALKTTYLIEKGISLQKKRDANEILEELGKFGVANPENMTPEEQAQKYGELYEMFVLRDGDNIRALAQSVLARIKMELGAHGIVVNDEDAEAMYDGFFGSIVAGTGEKIVADAKNWVEDSIKHKTSGSYIKQDYYELKSIDEVALLGSQPGDDEFVSLLATDDEDEDIDGEMAGGRSDSPIAKHLSLSRRPSLFRGGDSPTKDAGQGLLKKAGSSIASNLSKMANNDRQESNPTTIGDSSSGEAKSRTNFKVQRTQSKEEDNQHIHSKKDEDSKQNLSGSKRRKRSTKAQVDPASDTSGEKSCESTDKQGEGGDKTASQTNAMEDNEGGKDAHVVAANNDTNTSHTDDNASVRPLTGALEDPNYRRGSTAPLNPGYNSADLDLDPNGARPDEMHVSHDETDRLPQGVGLEYEEEPPPVVEEVVETPPLRPRTPEPKVPDIVFSGLETGKNATVAARYIQLLGLGNVTVIQPEAELLTQLDSPQRPLVDLVRELLACLRAYRPLLIIWYVYSLALL